MVKKIAVIIETGVIGEMRMEWCFVIEMILTGVNNRYNGCLNNNI